jgi:shikimate kinase
MASGKTTLGKVLANELGIRFVDLDDLIMERTGKTIKNIFAKEGEIKFREYEKEALDFILQEDNIVLSTGGGVPCFGDNMDKLLQAGRVVYLKLPVEDLVERMVKSKVDRPLIAGMNEQELHAYVGEKLKERVPFYERASHIIDAKSMTVQELVEKIK